MDETLTPLMESASSDSASKASWYALQVRSRKEGYVASQIQGQGYECLLPTYKSVRKWSDRVKELEQPLFPGYLFCRFDFQNRRPVITTPGVLQIVGYGRTAISVSDGDSITAVGCVFWNAQAAVALPGSRPARTRELRNIIRAGRNSGQREGKSSCCSFGDAPAAIGGNGSGNIMAFRGQGRDAREYGAADTSPDPRADGDLSSIGWESEQEK